MKVTRLLSYISSILLLMPFVFLLIFLVNDHLVKNKSGFDFWGIFLVTLMPFSSISMISELALRKLKHKSNVYHGPGSDIRLISSAFGVVPGISGWVLFLVTF